MSTVDLGTSDYEWDLQHLHAAMFVYYSAAALLIYDSFCIAAREVEHIFSGSWGFIQSIYIFLRATACVQLAFYIYVNQNNHLSAPLCSSYAWVGGLTTSVILPATTKVLLVLRLRAIWLYDVRVTLLLVSVTIIEVVLGIWRTVIAGIVNGAGAIGDYPLHGCYATDSSPLSSLMAPTIVAFGTARTLSAAVELVLVCIKLFQATKTVYLAGSSLPDRIKHLRRFTPVLYVFYRDGTLFVFPIFVINAFDLISALASHYGHLEPFLVNITPLFGLVYYACGTRLVLHLREANCKLSKTIVTDRWSTMIQFDHGTQPFRQESLAEGLEENTGIELRSLHKTLGSRSRGVGHVA